MKAKAPRTDLQPPNAPTVNDLVVEPLINKPLVAQRTGRTPRWVEQEMLRGLPHYKLGSRTAFLWSEILEYLAKNCRVCRQGKATK